MSYSHFNMFERGKLELLHSQGWSTRVIARELGRHHSSVARELKRNQISNEYKADAAHIASEERRNLVRYLGKHTPERIDYITEKLEATWSPEQIAGRMKQDYPDIRISFKTIYRWLYSGLLVQGSIEVLRHKGKRRKPAETRGRFNIGRTISQRPVEVRKRESFGHWELDTVVSSRGRSKACVATFAERKTRWYLAVKMPDRTASSMEEAFDKVAKSYPTPTFQTATVDRGKEFACHRNLESSHKIKVYFADPYSSWQRGTNENANGLLREFFPKGHDFARVTEEELSHAIELINNRPRKCLGWKTAYESFVSELSHLA